MTSLLEHLMRARGDTNDRLFSLAIWGHYPLTNDPLPCNECGAALLLMEHTPTPGDLTRTEQRWVDITRDVASPIYPPVTGSDRLVGLAWRDHHPGRCADVARGDGRPPIILLAANEWS